MKEIKDTELNYINGEKILEGDKVELEYMATGALYEKVKGEIVYKNAAFYFISDDKDIFTGKNFEMMIASILENNAKVPHKYPINITKLLTPIDS